MGPARAPPRLEQVLVQEGFPVRARREDPGLCGVEGQAHDADYPMADSAYRSITQRRTLCSSIPSPPYGESSPIYGI